MQLAGFEVEVFKTAERGGSRGRVLVLLHGFTGSSASWSDVIGRLTERRTVVAVNLPGHHPGSPVDARGGFSATVDALARMVRGLDSVAGATRGRAHLVGYSLGGRLALATLVKHGELFDRATLIGASAGLDSAEARAKRTESDHAWIELLRKEGTRAFVAAWERQALLRPRADVPRERIEAQRAVRLAHDASSLARVLEHFGLAEMPSYWGALRKLSMPVRFVAGAEDEKFVVLSTKMAALAPRSELAVIYEAGHNVLVDRPDALARVLCTP